MKHNVHPLRRSAILFLGLFLSMLFMVRAAAARPVSQSDLPGAISSETDAGAVGSWAAASLVPDPLSSAVRPDSTAVRNVSDKGYVTAPPDLPMLKITKWPGELGEGYIFANTYDYWPRPAEGPNYLLILDNDGEVVYYGNPFGLPVTVDFKKQENGLLSFFAPAVHVNKFFTMNNKYEIVGDFEAVGYTTDLHDLEILDNGHALLLIHDLRAFDMSAIFPGGSKKAPVIGCIAQEVDAQNRLIHEWSSWDHLDEIEITDTYQPLNDVPLRYIHCNSIEEDLDGNWLISNRNLSEVTKINKVTGDIIWRLGGKKNMFDFVNDTGFTFQHDGRRLANGRITVYDNGIGHTPTQSRGVEYIVDETNMTAEATTIFRTDPDAKSVAMGNMQTLPNGNRVVGWGTWSAPFMTEFDPDGNRLLEIETDENFGSYRAFRFPWQGYPTWPPLLRAIVDGDKADLYFSWNGSTETAAYKIMSGSDLSNLGTIATVKRDGFETSFTYTLPQPGVWYFRVVPIDKDGTAGIQSNFVVAAAGGEKHYMASVFSD
jgi:Arylsulfotransferase (ASST)